MTAAERLLVAPEKPGRFTARLESTGELIANSSRQPLVDGARELLARGFDPAALLTMRQHDRPYDSFRPAPIGQWAKWTYEESESVGLKRRAWKAYPETAAGMPVAEGRERRKSGSEPSDDVRGHPEEARFYSEPPPPPR
jgi:hypothetical protein